MGVFLGHSYYFSSFCFLSAYFLHLLQSNSTLYDFISKENLLDINPKILQNSNELFGFIAENAKEKKKILIIIEKIKPIRGRWSDDNTISHQNTETIVTF